MKRRAILILFASLSFVQGSLDPIDNPYFDDFLQIHQTLSQKQKNTVEYAKRQVNPSHDEVRQRLEIQVRQLFPNIHGLKDTNPQCERDFNALFENLVTGTDWAWLMLDSTAKSLLPDGLLGGNFWNLGMFDECLNVEASYETNKTRSSFRGQHCSVNEVIFGGDIDLVPPGALFRRQQRFDGVRAIQEFPLPMRSICVPDSCSVEDIRTVIAFNDSDTVIGVGVEPLGCSSNKVEYDAPDKLFLSLVTAVSILVLCGTVLDTHLRTLSLEVRDQTKGIQALVAFSVLSNSKKIFGTEHSKGSITCLHGLRVLSMIGVIYGHSYSNANMLGATNAFQSFLDYSKQFVMSIVFALPLVVDTFFFLSGFLVAYLLLKEVQKRNGRFNFIMYYVHRYIRLTPVYMVVVWFSATLLIKMTSGPFWIFMEGERKGCRNTWYQNMLYYQNFRTPFFYDENDMYEETGCLGIAWYLAVDMQLYIIAPLFIIPLYFASSVLALIFLGTSILGSLAVRLAMIYYNGWPGFLLNFHDDAPDTSEQMEELYIKPYTRFGPYLVGVLAAYLLLKIKEFNYKPKSKLFVGIGWTIAAGALLFPVFYPYAWYPYDAPQWSLNNSRIFGALHRTIWAFGLLWLVLACDVGYGGLINSILSWRMFLPLSRLSYTTYLAHGVVMPWVTVADKHVHTNSHEYFFQVFAVGWSVSTAVAVLLSLWFEAPILNLEKIFLGGLISGPQLKTTTFPMGLGLVENSKSQGGPLANGGLSSVSVVENNDIRRMLDKSSNHWSQSNDPEMGIGGDDFVNGTPGKGVYFN